MSNCESLISFPGIVLVQNTMQRCHPLSHFDVASPALMKVKVVCPDGSRSPAQTQQPPPTREALTDELKPSGPFKSLKSN